MIASALKKSGLSARKAARQADLSDARWRQIVSGYQSVSGSPAPVRAPADTLARMAQVVGVTPTELREAQREDAARELEELQQAEQPSAPMPAGGYAPPLEAVTAIMAALSPEAQEEVIRRLGYMTPAHAPKGVTPEHQHRRTG
ncbi:helix-turn-helix domain-containing protein [[Kitasatospora] papulosa]|uniref:helix-turn-helix domain-containing protein n=1 Tax=[Kitasatospora] papulosa TaxID=1464011 RepID=UPI003673FF7C